MKGPQEEKGQKGLPTSQASPTLTMKASTILALCGLFVLLALPAILANTCGVHSPFSFISFSFALVGLLTHPSTG
jgi:hypothetical protein